jgi:hypothetical protein
VEKLILNDRDASFAQTVDFQPLREDITPQVFQAQVQLLSVLCGDPRQSLLQGVLELYDLGILFANLLLHEWRDVVTVEQVPVLRSHGKDDFLDIYRVDPSPRHNGQWLRIRAPRFIPLLEHVVHVLRGCILGNDARATCPLGLGKYRDLAALLRHRVLKLCRALCTEQAPVDREVGKGFNFSRVGTVEGI